MALFGRSRASRQEESPETPSDIDEILPVEEPAPELPTTLDGYRDHVLVRAEPLQPFGVNILASLGLPLCETIVSDLDVPHFDTALAAGYGVRAEDIRAASLSSPVSLAVVGEVEAGAIAIDVLAPRTAMLLAAGAPVPAGVDTIVGLRDTDCGLADVAVRRATDVGENIRRQGDDVSDGDVLAHAGDRVTPALVGVFAGIGIDRILVRPRPRVVVMSFAQDTVDPGLPLTHRGESYDAASWYVSAAVRQTGAIVVHVEPDLTDPASLRQVLADQLIRADLIITTGGAEPNGLLRGILTDDEGAEFVTLSVNPGGDYGFTLLDRTVPLLMLPAGLVAAAAGFAEVGYPLLRRLQGLADDTEVGFAPAGRLFVPDVAGETSYIPVALIDGQLVRCASPHSELQAMNGSAGLAIVAEQIAAGGMVTYLPWRTSDR